MVDPPPPPFQEHWLFDDGRPQRVAMSFFSLGVPKSQFIVFFPKCHYSNKCSNPIFFRYAQPFLSRSRMNPAKCSFILGKTFATHSCCVVEIPL